MLLFKIYIQKIKLIFLFMIRILTYKSTQKSLSHCKKRSKRRRRKIYNTVTTVHVENWSRLPEYRDYTKEFSHNSKLCESMCATQALIQEFAISTVKYYVMSNLPASTLKGSLIMRSRKLSHQMKKLYSDQNEILMPSNGSDPDIDAMDLTLWVWLAEHVCKKSKSKGKMYAMKLRQIRNKLAHQSPRLRGDWDKLLIETEEALIGLGVSESDIRETKINKLEQAKEAVIIPKHHVFPICTEQGSIDFLPRCGWRALSPLEENRIETPVPNIIISHTVTNGPADSLNRCALEVRNIQEFNMTGNKFSDIAYNFLIGNDGTVYEGRGLDFIAATAYGWNRQSYGIAFIGTYMDNTPSEKALESLQLFLHYLRVTGKVAKDYDLYALRQLRSKFPYAPGDATYDILKTWPHWREYDKPT